MDLRLTSARRKMSTGVLLGVASLVVDAAAGLVQLPLVMRFLPASEAGMWVLCLSFAPFLMLAQAGLGPIVTRRTAALRAIDDIDGSGRAAGKRARSLPHRCIRGAVRDGGRSTSCMPATRSPQAH